VRRECEKPVAATDLRLGDSATVTVERAAGTLAATEVEVVRPGGSKMATSPQASARPQPMMPATRHTQ
jgi:hypothetical protein